eukprot:3860589-Prymnesium_polylepis.1
MKASMLGAQRALYNARAFVLGRPPLVDCRTDVVSIFVSFLVLSISMLLTAAVGAQPPDPSVHWAGHSWIHLMKRLHVMLSIGCFLIELSSAFFALFALHRILCGGFNTYATSSAEVRLSGERTNARTRPAPPPSQARAHEAGYPEPPPRPLFLVGSASVTTPLVCVGVRTCVTVFGERKVTSPHVPTMATLRFTRSQLLVNELEFETVAVLSYFFAGARIAAQLPLRFTNKTPFCVLEYCPLGQSKLSSPSSHGWRCVLAA